MASFFLSRYIRTIPKPTLYIIISINIPSSSILYILLPLLPTIIPPIVSFTNITTVGNLIIQYKPCNINFLKYSVK